jgi:hypothetical protein
VVWNYSVSPQVSWSAQTIIHQYKNEIPGWGGETPRDRLKPDLDRWAKIAISLSDEPRCCCWAVIDIIVKCNNSITCINSIRCVMNVHASYIYITRYLLKFKN